MTGEPIIFYNFVFPSVRLATMLLRDLSRTLTQQSAAFLVAKPSRDTDTKRYARRGWSRGDKIHGETNSADCQINAHTYSWKINYYHLHPAVGAKGSVMITDVFHWKTKRHGIFNLSLLLLLTVTWQEICYSGAKTHSVIFWNKKYNETMNYNKSYSRIESCMILNTDRCLLKINTWKNEKFVIHT